MTIATAERTDRLLTMSETADMLGCSLAHLKKLVYGGEIDSLHLTPRMRRIRLTEIEAYIRRLQEEQAS